MDRRAKLDDLLEAEDGQLLEELRLSLGGGVSKREIDLATEICRIAPPQRGTSPPEAATAPNITGTAG